MKYGCVHYFAPNWEDEESIEKYELMKCYKVKIENKSDKLWEDNDYKRYYEEALKRIIDLRK